MKDVNIYVETGQTPVVKQDSATAYMVEMFREEHEKNQKKGSESVEVKDKTLLTLNEAAKYFNIGMPKIRELTADDHCPYVLWNGSKRLIKRKPFEEYLYKQHSI